MAGHSGTSLSVAHLFTLPSRPARARTFPAGTLETGCSAAPIIINNATLPPPRSRGGASSSTSISEPSPFSPHVRPGRRVKCRFDAGGSPAVGPASGGGGIQSSPRGDACLHAPGLRGWYFGPSTCRGRREKVAGKKRQSYHRETRTRRQVKKAALLEEGDSRRKNRQPYQWKPRT